MIARGLSRGGDSDDEIVLIRETGEERGKAREQRREEARALFGTDALQIPHQLGPERDVFPGGAVRLERRAGAIDREVEDRDLPGEPLKPVRLVRSALRIAVTPGKRKCVPTEAIGRCERGRGVPAAGRIEGREVSHEHGGQPPVANDVVCREDETMVVGADLHHDGSGERPVLQIEGERNLACQERVPGVQLRLGRLARPFEHLERHVHALVDHERQPVPAERRAERFVPCDQVREGPTQRLDVERPLHPQRDRLVVGERGVVHDLHGRPDLPLGLGGRHRGEKERSGKRIELRLRARTCALRVVYEIGHGKLCLFAS